MRAAGGYEVTKQGEQCKERYGSDGKQVQKVAIVYKFKVMVQKTQQFVILREKKSFGLSLFRLKLIQCYLLKETACSPLARVETQTKSRGQSRMRGWQ